jgi:maleylpyruvate isomerase
MDDTAAVIAGCQASHRRLSGTLGSLTDDAARAPSRLPGWTVGHVLTHLARNADSHARILEAAGRGEAVEQYAGGYEQRTADIEAGAGRPAVDLVDDVRRAATALEKAWVAWDGHGLSGGEEWPCRRLPFLRWREVEIHHVDLGLGYEAADWPADYLAIELPRALATVPDRLPRPADRRRLLAWLVGRSPQPDGLALDRW